MEKALRLRKKEDFNLVYRSGWSCFNRDFQIVSKPNGRTHNRYGFSLSRKFGKAHERNRMKRQLREIVRQEETRFPRGYDFIILPRSAAKGCSYTHLEHSLFHCLSFWSAKRPGKHFKPTAR